MRFLKLNKWLLINFVFCSPFLIGSELTDYSPNDLITKTASKQPSQLHIENNTHPFFFDTNIGIGFLYFHKVSGNLAQKPNLVFNLGAFIEAPITTPLSYNRTPSFEYNFGQQYFSFLKVALAYQHQGNIVIQTPVIAANPFSFPLIRTYSQLTTNLNLDGLFFKFIFSLPKPIRLAFFQVKPQIGVGVGPAWLSWTQVDRLDTVTQTLGQVFLNSFSYPIRQKINANAAWTAQASLDFSQKSFYPNFFLSLGCRYTQWGQARNIGLLKDQGSFKISQVKPLRIKTVYQFAPFVGFEWQFSPSINFLKRTLKKSELKSPYWVKGQSPYYVPSLWTQTNAGVGFLYFDQVQGNLQGSPTSFFLATQNVPIQKKMTYNRTPLFEYLVGFNLLNWLDLSTSYQHQSEVVFQTQYLSGKLTNSTSFQNLDKAQFTGYVSLDALMLKSYFQIPFHLVYKRAKLNSYAALGVGAGWQSWSQISVNYTSQTRTDTLPFKQKFSPNAVWMAELGLNLQSIDPFNSFSFRLGCKYNQWGQARNMGKFGQQDGSPFTLYKPVRIKMIYQFAPFLGLQWNFGFHDRYTLKLEPNKQFKRIEKTHSPTGINIQFNTALGLLYFDRVRVNLTPISMVDFNAVIGKAPAKGRLSYTPSVVFEYLAAYQYKPWLNLGLSYQYQPYTTIQTPIVQGQVINAQLHSSQAFFSSNLNINALALKAYGISPLSLCVKTFKIAPYLAVGVGASWLTFNRSYVLYSPIILGSNTPYRSAIIHFRQKVCANAFFMLDAGLKAFPLTKSQAFSLQVGCKYNQWGQARNIGKLSQQNTLNYGLYQPVSIKMVYQFAPYFGFQWNF